MQTYNPQKIEQKWAKVWEKKKTWKVDLKKAKNPYYNLMMFPYPSAEGLHVGNVYAFTGSDIHGRFRRMQGNDVFEPIGFDSFGIHSENFAIKQGTHPKTQTAKNIKHFKEQLKQLGALFDWSRAVTTNEPEYYKWTQWLFLQLYKAGLAYRSKAPVDWCPSCKTVLADEQVINGKCERCNSEVIQKEMEQWFFKITKYAERLLKNLDTIDWSERTKLAQKNWIGKSEGAEIEFSIADSNSKIKVFTTRPDTLFGATYMVLAPEHKLVNELQSRITNWNEVVAYREQAKRKSEIERVELAKEKTGVELKGIKAINPANKEQIPVFIADYVLASYGTGAIMAVPAHDERDMEFAQKFKLPVSNAPLVSVEEGIQKGGGRKVIKYHLRDWLISRQRYWGPPIPIIYCKKCALRDPSGQGIVPVPEKDLPVLLPFVKNYRPEGTGKSPLASLPSFVKTKCPQCKGAAERETDVSDTFLDSAWYFFRYPSSDYKKGSFEKTITEKWLPVDMYIGGQEHAVLHLLYTRFITMALRDLGCIDFDEPFKKFRAHGLITKDGVKMSKSKGNVVNPDDYFKKYGADAVRMYLMFIGPFAEGGDWNDKGILGITRFLGRVWNLVQSKERNLVSQDLETKFLSSRHKTIKKITDDLENLKYNTAIASLMEYLNEPSKVDCQTLLILLAPFAPHIAEELWHALGNKDSVHSQPWPKYDSKLLEEEKIRLVLQVNGRVRDIIEVNPNISEHATKDFALQNEKIKKWIAGQPVKKVIFVPGRLINIVI